MSNFTVNGVYSYSTSNIYSYLGRVPSSAIRLERAFNEFPGAAVIVINCIAHAVYHLL